MTTISLKQCMEPGVFDEYDYMDLASALDKNLVIEEVKPFENDKGPGVFILAGIEGDDRLYKLCTHSLAITNLLTRPTVLQALADGDVIKCKLVQKKSSKTGRLMYTLIGE